ncbi:MAG TPA: hypothetical protein VLH83_06490, partial [Chthoniobacterales bacterium]|nr:hypothetical protein [Chthoniobacterales bacterium]
DRTRPGSNDNIGAADFDAPAKIDDGALGFELSAGQFKRLRDAHDFAHAIQQFKIAMIEIAVHAHRSKHGVRCASRTMHVKSVHHQLVNYVLDLGVRCALLHDDDHGSYSIPFPVNAACSHKIFWLTQFPAGLLRECTSGIIAGTGFCVCFSVGVAMHGETLGGAGFVNDALEETTDRCIGERAFVVLLRIFQDFLFAVRLIQRQICLLLQLAEFERALGTFVQQFDQLAVDFINAAPPIRKAHASLRGRRRRESPSDKVGTFGRFARKDGDLGKRHR